MLQRIAMKSAVLFCAFALSVVAHASADELKTVSVPPGDLGKALRILADQAGVEFIYQTEQIRGINTGGVSGDYNAREAVLKLLEGTQLQLRTDQASGAILIVRPDVLGDQPTANSREAPNAQFDDRLPASVVAANRTLTAQGETAPNEEISATSENRHRRTIDLQEVVVTGSHVTIGEHKPISPILVIDADQIERTGYSSTEQLFENLPQNFAGGQAGASADGVYGTGSNNLLNYAGGAGINLRGLGESSTLVLLNGHRMAASALGSFVDVSAIPLFAIERVEILTDGSSAIYGADAVGGVVNIRLKDQYEGVQAGLRYGSVTDGGRDEQLYSLAAGTTWATGNFFGGITYQSADALFTDERQSTADVPQPSTLLPESRLKSANVSAKQDLGEDLSVYAHGLFSERDVKTLRTSFVQERPVVNQKNSNTALSFDYSPSDRWSLQLSGSYGREHQIKDDNPLDIDTGSPLYVSHDELVFETTSINLLANFSLFTTGAGTAALALGGSFRRDSADSGLTVDDATVTDFRVRQEVTSAFGELQAPIVGSSQSIPWVDELQLSIAARYDDYSDFGAETSPYYGVRWALNKFVALRASYGESFRAPVALESILTGITQFLFAVPPVFPTPEGDSVPMFLLNGSKPLSPERARHLNIGLDLNPMENLTLSFNFFDVDYRDRIILPPTDVGVLLNLDAFGPLVTSFDSEEAAQAFMDQWAAQGGIVVDLTPEDGGAGDVRYVYDVRQQNATLLNLQGFDVTATYTREIKVGTLSWSVNAAHIEEMVTGFAGAIATFDQVGTNGNPPEWRGRLDMSLDAGPWSFNAGINHVDSYTNVSQAEDLPVDSWTTVDLMIRLSPERYFNASPFRDSSISLSVQNLFDEEPPYVDLGFLSPARYDAANASPLGRFIALELRKSW